MTISKLPVRPSLDSLRKQAKKLARDIAAGDSKATARARAQLPQAGLPFSQRDAQLVLAREYGFPGWKDLVKEVQQRLGRGLEWAVAEARRVIHDNDVEVLRQLLAEYPALLLWRGASWNSPGADGGGEDDRGLLGMATGSFGDSGDAFREEHLAERFGHGASARVPSANKEQNRPGDVSQLGRGNNAGPNHTPRIPCDFDNSTAPSVGTRLTLEHHVEPGKVLSSASLGCR